MSAAVTPVAHVDLVIRADPWTLPPSDQQAVDAHWHQQIAANPALWNGPAFLFDRLELKPGADGHLKAEGATTTFATFLHFRNAGRLGPGCWHMFPVGAVITADRRLMLGEMGPKTANAGRLYPPSGSFDPGDLVNGKLDPLANILREIAEETGIVLPRAEAIPEWLILPSSTGRFAITTVIPLPLPAAELEAMARAHMAVDHEEELADIRFHPFDSSLPEDRTVGYVNPLLAYLDATY